MNSGHDQARIGFCLCYAIDFWTSLGKGGHVWAALQKILIYKKCLLNKTSFTNGTYVLLCGEHPR